MKYVEVVAKPTSSQAVADIATKEEALDFRAGAVGEDGMQYMRLVIADDRLPAVLVGVMVAVALLPPATTLGLMLGHGDFVLATGAGLLLAVNIVCVNLARKLVFLLKGIRPRTWPEKKQAKRSMLVYILAWLVALVVLVLVIYTRSVLPS